MKHVRLIVRILEIILCSIAIIFLNYFYEVGIIRYALFILLLYLVGGITIFRCPQCKGDILKLEYWGRIKNEITCYHCKTKLKTYDRIPRLIYIFLILYFAYLFFISNKSAFEDLSLILFIIIAGLILNFNTKFEKVRE